MADSIVIVSAARTPIGGLLGDFSSLAAWELGGVAIKAAVERAHEYDRAHFETSVRQLVAGLADEPGTAPA